MTQHINTQSVFLNWRPPEKACNNSARNGLFFTFNCNSNIYFGDGGSTSFRCPGKNKRDLWVDVSIYVCKLYIFICMPFYGVYRLSTSTRFCGSLYVRLNLEALLCRRIPFVVRNGDESARPNINEYNRDVWKHSY